MGREKIRVAHSPDSDDAFMFYALATGKIDTGEFEFVHELRDIETLNQAALEGTYEVSAVSIHGYAYINDRYALLNSGASMGEGYGPILVSKASSRDLEDRTVAVPGLRTSAYLGLQIHSPGIETRVLPFDEITDAVLCGDVDLGLIIHEGQLSYRDAGLKKVFDLGEWWKDETGLPLPLGGNVIRRDLGAGKIAQISSLISQSIRYSLDNRESALAYALQFGRGLDASQADRFVSMYVNERTLDYGEDGRRAVRLFLDLGHEKGLIPHKVEVEFL